MKISSLNSNKLQIKWIGFRTDRDEKKLGRQLIHSLACIHVLGVLLSRGLGRKCFVRFSFSSWA